MCKQDIGNRNCPGLGIRTRAHIEWIGAIRPSEKNDREQTETFRRIPLLMLTSQIVGESLIDIFHGEQVR